MRWLKLFWLFGCAAAQLQLAGAEFTVTNTVEELPEAGHIQRVFITSAAGKFSLNPPPGWDVTSNTAESVVILRSERHGAAVRVQFHAKAAKGAAALKEAALERWPKAVTQGESTVLSRNSSGPTLDLQIGMEGLNGLRARMARLGFGAGAVDIALIGPDTRFADLHHVWNFVLASFEKMS